MSSEEIVVGIRRLREEFEKCVNCGLCQAVCPTYFTEGNEGLTARGKILLLSAMATDSLQPSQAVAQIFDNCLTCYACQTVCPAGVKTEKLWTVTRDLLAGYSRSTKLKRTLFRTLLTNDGLFRQTVKTGALLLGTEEEKGGKLTRFAVPLHPKAPLVGHLQDDYLPAGNPIGSVALLLGCSGNLMVPNVVMATIKLLTAGGYRVLIPKGQTCCGAPAINNGDYQSAKVLAGKHIRLFLDSGADWVTSPDASCLVAMKHEYPALMVDNTNSVTRSEAERFSTLCTDVARLTAVSLSKGRLELGTLKRRVTIHDSCHATHIGDRVRWREILNAINGIELAEMEESSLCCGFGGSYQFLHLDNSRRIAERKIANVLRTGAELLAVGSPGCMLHIKSSLSANHQGKVIPEVKHIIELVSQAVK